MISSGRPPYRVRVVDLFQRDHVAVYVQDVDHALLRLRPTQDGDPPSFAEPWVWEAPDERAYYAADQGEGATFVLPHEIARAVFDALRPILGEDTTVTSVTAAALADAIASRDRALQLVEALSLAKLPAAAQAHVFGPSSATGT